MGDASNPGLFYRDVTLTEHGGHFHIIRNRDWQQVFFPGSQAAATSYGEPSNDVQGPDENSGMISWLLGGTAGERYRIEFQRVVDMDKDMKTVSWPKLSA